MAKYPATLQIRLTTEQHQALEKIARTTKTSVPFVARWFLPASADREFFADLKESGAWKAMQDAFVDERTSAS